MFDTGMGVGMWLFWLLVVAAVVVLAGMLARRPGPAPDRNESPIDILKARYARGEIDESEFERRRRELER